MSKKGWKRRKYSVDYISTDAFKRLKREQNFLRYEHESLASKRVKLVTWTAEGISEVFEVLKERLKFLGIFFERNDK